MICWVRLGVFLPKRAERVSGSGPWRGRSFWRVVTWAGMVSGQGGVGGSGGLGGGSVGGEVDFFLFVGGGIRLGGGGGLVVGAEPADEAALFLGGAFVVEGDEAGEEGLLQGFGVRVGGVEAVGEGDGGDEVGPAVGFEQGGVEVVVELLEEGVEALVVDGFGLGVERGAGAEEVEHVADSASSVGKYLWQKVHDPR